jgi:hypothetical protein
VSTAITCPCSISYSADICTGGPGDCGYGACQVWTAFLSGAAPANLKFDGVDYQLQSPITTKAYIQVRLEACTQHNIKSSWREAGLFPKRALRTIDRGLTPELQIAKTPTPFDIFNQVFINSSPPDATTLQNANEPLNLTGAAYTTINTPVRRYIQKLTNGTEKLRAQTTIHQQDANNLRAIIKKRTTRKKGKRVILKGHFDISTQEFM